MNMKHLSAQRVGELLALLKINADDADERAGTTHLNVAVTGFNTTNGITIRNDADDVCNEGSFRQEARCCRVIRLCLPSLVLS